METTLVVIITSLHGVTAEHRQEEVPQITQNACVWPHSQLKTNAVLYHACSSKINTSQIFIFLLKPNSQLNYHHLVDYLQLQQEFLPSPHANLLQCDFPAPPTRR